MKQFLKQTIFFAILLSVILFLIKQTVPYYWGAALSGKYLILAQKINYLKEETSNNKFNTLILGSSEVNHHVIPKYFDEITNNISFNLGMNGMYLDECSYILEHLLEDKDAIDGISQIILEVKNPRPNPFNKHAVRSKYYLDWRRMIFVLRYFYFHDYYSIKLSYISSCIENLFSIGELIRIGQYHLNIDRLDPVRIKQSGYLESILGGEFSKDHVGISYRSPKTVASTYQDQVISDELNRLWTICQNKKIELYFLFPPNDQIHLNYSHPNSIYIGDGVDIPTLFLAEHRDRNGNHLNEKGAILFSTRLGFLFNRIQRNR